MYLEAKPAELGQSVRVRVEPRITSRYEQDGWNVYLGHTQCLLCVCEAIEDVPQALAELPRLARATGH